MWLRCLVILGLDCHEVFLMKYTQLSYIVCFTGYDVYPAHKFSMMNNLNSNEFSRKFSIHAVASGSAFDAYPLDSGSSHVSLLFASELIVSYVVQRFFWSTDVLEASCGPGFRLSFRVVSRYSLIWNRFADVAFRFLLMQSAPVIGVMFTSSILPVLYVFKFKSLDRGSPRDRSAKEGNTF